MLEGQPPPGAPGDGVAPGTPQATGFDVALLLAVLVGQAVPPDAPMPPGPPPEKAADASPTDAAAGEDTTPLAVSALVVVPVTPAAGPPPAVERATPAAGTPVTAASPGVSDRTSNAVASDAVPLPAVPIEPDVTPPPAAGDDPPPSVTAPTNRARPVDAGQAGTVPVSAPSSGAATRTEERPDRIPPEPAAVVTGEAIVAAAADGEAQPAPEGEGPRTRTDPLRPGEPAAPRERREPSAPHAPGRVEFAADAVAAPTPDGPPHDSRSAPEPAHGAREHELPQAAASHDAGGQDTLAPSAPRDLDRAQRPHGPAAPEPPAARTPDAVHQVERLVRLDELRPRPVNDGGDMRLELSPEGLGRIEVRISVRDDGVQANLLAQHDHAREALELHRPTLEAALGRSSLRLDGFTVGLGEHRQGDPGGTAPERRPPAADPRPGEAAPAPLPGASRRGGLSLRA